jgi:hypothetical protein
MRRNQGNLHIRSLVLWVATMVAVTGCSEPVTRAPSADRPEPRATVVPESVLDAFARLNSGLLSAVGGRDPEEVLRVTVPGPARRRALRAIKELRRDQVIDETQFETVDLIVRDESDSTAVLVEVRQVFPCFRSTDGVVVTERDIAVEQRVRWSLTFGGHGWRLNRGKLLSDRRIPGGEAACA